MTRVAIVTGAAHNIGRAIAERLIAADMNVVVTDLDEAVRAWPGDEVAVHIGDVSTSSGAKELVAQAVTRFGRVDVLVNNAGGGVIRPFLDHDEASIAETLSRNLLTTVHCCRAVLPGMVDRQYGRIVNIGAESVRNGLWWHAMYNGAKGGVHGLTTGLAREFAPVGITVNCVAPSIVATRVVQQALAAGDALPAESKWMLDQTLATIPIGRPATVAEVAESVAFFASDAASFITGQVVSVNGGSSML